MIPQIALRINGKYFCKTTCISKDVIGIHRDAMTKFMSVALETPMLSWDYIKTLMATRITWMIVRWIGS
jgi:hypothetical protein